MEELRAKFLKIYANIPLDLRDEIAVVVEGQPVSWAVAFIEVKAGSEKSKIILKELAELSII